MAHLKLDLVLRETGYDMGQPHGTPGAMPSGKEQQRLRVFLTNSLEEAHPDTGTLFASWLSQEANEANAVKRDTPVMVVLGNPPYSGISSNMGEWISGLIEDYKYVDGEHFGERKHWPHDDYVKFIRYGEHFIEKTGEGVLAYINNHSFLDNPTFRGMRWHLLNTFDKIYVIDLHGNAKKKEVGPDGSKDENVFDIQQGVSINLFVRTAAKKKGQLGTVYHGDLWGMRSDKYDVLTDGSLRTLELSPVKCSPPFYFMQPKDESALADYNRGLQVADLFLNSSVGFVSGKDEINIGMTRDEVIANVKFVRDNDEQVVRTRFAIRPKDARDWTVPTATNDIEANFSEDRFIECVYRPFDFRFMFYTGNSRGAFASPQRKVMHHLQAGPNIAVAIPRQTKESLGGLAVKFSSGHKVFSAYDINTLFPLYLYPENTNQSAAIEQLVQPNLDTELVEPFAQNIGLTYRFDPKALWVHGAGKDLTPLDVLDYCYAVLHSPAYREKYKEFLKSDFPRIP
ncbi:MAG: DNA methyltransferase, partial [Flavobacteriales bacterium]|nr:DNA methyltransferase [Flavobacteriales bacterium]